MTHNTLQTKPTRMAPEGRATKISLFASSFFLGQALGVSVGGILYEGIGAFVLSRPLGC